MAHSKTPMILLSFANDAEAPLRELAVEQDALREALDQARRDGICEIQAIAAATPEKIIKTFQQYRDRIRIFHYGGHSDREALFLWKDFPGQDNTKATHLAEFLGSQENLELVFINGCLSVGQAEAYHGEGTKAVIVTDRLIGDVAAREFARHFYQGLAGGATISEAFRSAETGYKTKHGGLPRGAGFREASERSPWRLFPTGPHDWRLPLVAQRLTRIPTIDLKKEFLGREADMQRLKEKLENTSKVVLMNGLGGIGKTVLATAYVQQYGGDYDHLAWINRGEDLINSFALNKDLEERLGIPLEQEEDLKARFHRILRKLNQLPGQNLLVIDNAQDQVAQKEIYDTLPSPPSWRVLLTSRRNLSGFDRLPLDTLQPESARALFGLHYSGAFTEEALEALLKEIGYHTLTIELLAKLLDRLNNVLSVAALTKTLKEKQLDNPRLQQKVWARHSGEERGVYMHLMKAFELIDLTDQEKWLLKQFIVLPVERYTVPTLADFLQAEPLDINESLNNLSDKGWLTLHEDKTFSIHRLISKVAEYHLHLGFEDLETLVERLIQKMNVDAYTSRVTATAPWINYATTVANYFTEENQVQLATLQNTIAKAYRSFGQYEEALDYSQRALAIRESVLRTNHPDVAKSYNDIANTYRSLRQFEEALDYSQKALAIVESVLGANHPDLAGYYNDIANIYRSLRQYEEALVYHQKTQTIGESVLEVNHPNLAISYNNIANTYHSLGQYEEALAYYQKALAIMESVLEVNHPTLSTSYNNIAATYYLLGQYEEALIYHQKDLAIGESVLGTNHPNLAESYYNIALTYHALGQKEKADEYEKKAAGIRMKRNG